MKPQTETILRHLLRERNITPMEAACVYKVRSITSRISEIKAAGFKVQRIFHKDATGQRYAKYYL